MSMTEAASAVAKTIDEISAFIAESTDRKEKVEREHEVLCSQIEGATLDLNRAKRALATLNGDDEPKPRGGKAVEGMAQTPQERYESRTGIDTLSMPGRNR